MLYKTINTFCWRRLGYSLDPEPLGKLSTELVDGNVSPLRSLHSGPAGAGAGGGGFGPDARRRDIFFCTSCLNPRMRPTSDTPLERPPDSPACRITVQFSLLCMSYLPFARAPYHDISSQYDSFNEHVPVQSSAIIWIIFWHCIHNALTLWSNVTLKKSTDTHRIHTVYDIWTLTNVATSAHHQSLTWARLIQSMPSNTTSLTSILLLFFQMLSYIQVFFF